MDEERFDAEMAFLDQMFRAELMRFKDAPPAQRDRVLDSLAEAGALPWLVEAFENDADPALREYARLAQARLDGTN